MSNTEPDDLMAITISLEFRAKLNPDVNDPPALEQFMEHGVCLPAEEETADYLEEIADAIRERRLYGFMMHECATGPVGSGEWIEKSTEDMLAESKAKDGQNVVPLKPSED